MYTGVTRQIKAKTAENAACPRKTGGFLLGEIAYEKRKDKDGMTGASTVPARPV